MSKKNTGNLGYIPKKTKQGRGRFTKKPAAGGENFLQGYRSGSPPSKARSKKKPYRGQGS
jgi:hypothetical protein|tara:strand:- start:145 stop:324 length:180 start_codon:yes stop_codon:yes gene_type:complete